MSVLRQLLLGSCTLTLLFTVTSGAKAGEWDQKVVATFNAPVEIPGQILPSGTYVFKLFDSRSTRDIVQVSNADESHLLATVFSIPRHRPNPTDKAAFMFEERGSDSPQAIRAWFYPGRLQGHEFIYGRRKAEAVNAGTPALVSETAGNPPNAPDGSPLISAQAKVTDQTQTAELQTAPEPSTTFYASVVAKPLPKTASTTPLIALLGMLSLGGAFGLKMLAKRVS
jgi:hypothetical protein